MKISDLFKQEKVTLSFEVFPPKTSSTYESVAQATQEIAALRPDFMSVTYGAGGGTSEHTVHIASDLQKKYGVTVLTHLTCVSSTREHVATMLEKFKQQGIENVLALRGDIPAGGAPADDYHYAAELVRDIKAQGDFCIALYNPASKKRTDHLRRACDILLEVQPPETVCGLVRNIGREGEEYTLTTLGELRDTTVDMLTTVFVGNSRTRVVNGRMVTPRGYRGV